MDFVLHLNYFIEFNFHLVMTYNKSSHEMSFLIKWMDGAMTSLRTMLVNISTLFSSTGSTSKCNILSLIGRNSIIRLTTTTAVNKTSFRISITGLRWRTQFWSLVEYHVRKVAIKSSLIKFYSSCYCSSFFLNFTSVILYGHLVFIINMFLANHEFSCRVEKLSTD